MLRISLSHSQVVGMVGLNGSVDKHYLTVDELVRKFPVPYWILNNKNTRGPFPHDNDTGVRGDRVLTC